MTLTEVLPALNEGLPLDDVFSNAQATQLFEALAEENIIMFDSGVVVSLHRPSVVVDCSLTSVASLSSSFRVFWSLGSDLCCGLVNEPYLCVACIDAYLTFGRRPANTSTRRSAVTLARRDSLIVVGLLSIRGLVPTDTSYRTRLEGARRKEQDDSGA